MPAITGVERDKKFVPHIENNPWTLSPDGQQAIIVVPSSIMQPNLEWAEYASFWIHFEYGVSLGGAITVGVERDSLTVKVEGKDNVQKLRDKKILFIPQSTAPAAGGAATIENG